MPNLTEEERARVNDCKHSVQSAAASLSQVDRRKIPRVKEVEQCLENAGAVLRDALQDPLQSKPRPGV